MAGSNTEITPRIVQPYWHRPDKLLRQSLSLFYLSWLTQWKRMPYWVVRYGMHCLPGAAGAKGMGCIGFPSHPVWEITSACNLSCIHCHTSGGKETDYELTTEEGKQLIA